MRGVRREMRGNETESQLNHYFSHFTFCRNAFTSCNRHRLRFSSRLLSPSLSLFLLRNSLREHERVKRNETEIKRRRNKSERNGDDGEEKTFAIGLGQQKFGK